MSSDLSSDHTTSIKRAYKDFLNTECGALAYARFKKILYTEDDSLVQSLNNNVLQYLPLAVDDCLDVCDIGGGDGKRIRRILRYLHDKFALRFNLDFVEQSSWLIQSFDVNEISGFTNVHKFEMPFEAVELRGAYQLVLLIHSIFAFQDESTIEKVLTLAKPRGNMIVVSNAENSFLGGLKRILDANFSDRRFEIQDLRRFLDDRGILVQETHCETRWALTADSLTTGVEAIVNWLSLGRWKDLVESRKREIWRYVADNSSEVGQRIIFSEDEVILVISYLEMES
jgi:hypothetical protein